MQDMLSLQIRCKISSPGDLTVTLFSEISGVAVRF